METQEERFSENETDEHNFCKAIINKAAKYWIGVFPSNSIYDIDDLRSEGWETYLRCKNLYKEDIGVKFTTYLYSSVRIRMLRLLQKSKRKNVRSVDLHSACEDNFDNYEGIISQYSACKEPHDRRCMIFDALVAISEVSLDFAIMIKDGVPEELLNYSRRIRRTNRFRKGVKSNINRVKPTKEDIESFFGVELSVLKKLVYKYI